MTASFSYHASFFPEATDDEEDDRDIPPYSPYASDRNDSMHSVVPKVPRQWQPPSFSLTTRDHREEAYKEDSSSSPFLFSTPFRYSAAPPPFLPMRKRTSRESSTSLFSAPCVFPNSTFQRTTASGAHGPTNGSLPPTTTALHPSFFSSSSSSSFGPVWPHHSVSPLHRTEGSAPASPTFSRSWGEKDFYWSGGGGSMRDTPPIVMVDHAAMPSSSSGGSRVPYVSIPHTAFFAVPPTARSPYAPCLLDGVAYEHPEGNPLPVLDRLESERGGDGREACPPCDAYYNDALSYPTPPQTMRSLPLPPYPLLWPHRACDPRGGHVLSGDGRGDELEGEHEGHPWPYPPTTATPAARRFLPVDDSTACPPDGREGQGGGDDVFAQEEEDENLLLPPSSPSSSAFFDLDAILSHSAYLRNGSRSAVSLSMHRSHSYFRPAKDDGAPKERRGSISHPASHPIPSTSGSSRTSSVAAARVHRLMGTACRSVSHSVSSLAPPTSIRPSRMGGSPSSAFQPLKRLWLESEAEERNHIHEGKCGAWNASSFPHHENAAAAVPEPTGIGGTSHHHSPSSSSSSSFFVPDYRFQSYCVASVLHSGARSREVGVALCHFPSMVFSLTQFSDGLTYNKLLSFLSAKDPVEVVLPFASNASSSSSHFIPTLLQHLPEDTTCTALPRSLFHSERGVQLIMELQSSALCHATPTGEDGAQPFSSPWNGGECRQTVDTEKEGHTVSSCRSGMRLSSQFLEQEASDRYLCVAAAHALMQYLQSLQNCRWRPHSLCIRYEELEQYMEMSRATARALHLIPSSSATSFFSCASHRTKREGSSAAAHPSSTTSSMTLIDVLPPACTVMGQRFLRSALLQPLREKFAIACRQDVVEWLLRPPYRLMALRQSLHGEEGGGGGLAHTDLERLCAELLVVWDPVSRDAEGECSTSWSQDESDGKEASPSHGRYRPPKAEEESEPSWVETRKERREKDVHQTTSPLPFDDRSFVLSTFEYHLRKVQQLHDYWETLNGCQDFFLVLGRLLGFHKDEEGEEAEEETEDGVRGVPSPTAIPTNTGTARPSSSSSAGLCSSSAESPPSFPSLTGNTSTPEKPLLLRHVFCTLRACHISSLLDVLKEYLDESILRSHTTTTTTAARSAPSFHTAPPVPYNRRYATRGGGRGRSGGDGRRHGPLHTPYYGAAPRRWDNRQGGNGAARRPPAWPYANASYGGEHGERRLPPRPGTRPTSGSPDGLKANIFRLLRLSFMIRAGPSTAISIPTSPLHLLPLYRQRLSMLLGKISQHTECLQRQYGLTTLRLEPDNPCSAWRRRGRIGGDRRTRVVGAWSTSRKSISSAQRLYRFSFCASEMHKVKHIQFTFMYGVGRSHLTAALEMWRHTHSRAPSPSSLSSSSSSSSSSSTSDTSSEDDEEEEEERPPQKKRRCVSTPRTAVAASSSSRGAAEQHRDAWCGAAAGRNTGRQPAFGVPKTHSPNTRIRCSTEALDDLCVEVHECLAYIFAEEVRLARPLLDRLQHHVGHLQAMGESIALVDTLMSFAVYAATQQGRRPTLLEPSSSPSSSSTTTTTLPHVSFYQSRPPCMVSATGDACRAGDLSPPSWALPVRAKDSAAPSSLPLPRSETENEDEEGGEIGRRWSGKATWAPPPPPAMDSPRAGRSAFPVVNTIEWEEGVPLVVVTGPNMSGKTTLLRQVGQLQVLAQSGCFLPVGDDRAAGEESLSSTDESRKMRGGKDNERNEGISFPPSSSPYGTQKTQIALVHRLMAHLLCDDLPSATLSTFKKELLLLGEVTEAIAVDCGMPAEVRGTGGEDRCTTGQHPCGAREKENKEGGEGMKPAPSAVRPLNASAAVDTPYFPCCKSSLILIDELGRSTNTQEGFALAWAFGRFVCELPLSLLPTSSTHPGCAPCATGEECASRPLTKEMASPCVGGHTRPPPIRVLLTTHFEGLTGLCHLYPEAVRHHHFAFTTTTTTTTTTTSQHSVTHDHTPHSPSPHTMKDARRDLPARSAPRRTIFSTSHQLCSGPCPSSRGVHYGLALAKRLQLLPEVVEMAYQLSALEEQAAAALAAEEAAIQTTRIGVGGKVEGVALAKSTGEESKGNTLPKDA